MFFTAIHQMMSERTTDSILTAEVERAEGRSPEPPRTTDRQRASAGTGRRLPTSRSTSYTEDYRTDFQHGAVRGAG